MGTLFLWATYRKALEDREYFRDKSKRAVKELIACHPDIDSIVKFDLTCPGDYEFSDAIVSTDQKVQYTGTAKSYQYLTDQFKSKNSRYNFVSIHNMF